MNPIQLDLSLSVVGPRERLPRLERWCLALRISAGFAANPVTDSDAHALITASLPWKIWPGDLPKILLVDENGHEHTIQAEPPQVEAPAFLAALQAAVESQGQALSPHLDFKVSAGQHERVVSDTEAAPRAVPWPGLLQTLTDLCPPTPSALKATWFFQIDRDLLGADQGDGAGWQLRDGASLSAAPLQLGDGTAKKGAAAGGAREYDYGNGSKAWCNVLALDGTLAHGLDELDNYWLSIRDSRDDSLLELAQQVEDALAPAALVATLSVQEWSEVCTVRGPDGSRRCTPAELTAALAAWSSKEWLQKFEGRPADLRRTVIRETLQGTGAPAALLRERYRVHAKSLLGAILDLPGLPGIDGEHWPRVVRLLSDRLLPSLFERSEPGPCQSGEGIRLVVGDERLRLAHETGSPVRAIDDVAAIQLFGRRSSDAAALRPDAAKPAPWHPLTAGRYAMTAVPPRGQDGLARIFGCGAAYLDGVLYREFDFVGANLVCRNPLQGAHAEALENALEAQKVSLLLAPPLRLASSDWTLRAVPLRYGDHYEFAASVIDRAGGQALELTSPGKPWLPDTERLKDLDPPQRDAVHFLRRVPVGTCNVLPPAGGWPQTPADVVLRCLEQAGPLAPGDRAVSVCLVPDPQEFAAPAEDALRADWPTEVSFVVEPPRGDEHTVSRWMMPATGQTQAQQAEQLKRLADTVKHILGRRHLRMQGLAPDDQPDLVLDPAVSAIGVRWQADAGGAPQDLVLPPQATTFNVAIGSSTGRASGTEFTVAPGSWLRLSVCALVKKADYERMDARALQALVQAGEWNGTDGTAYIAFEADVIYVECATAAMPELDASLLMLAENGSGDVEVRYAFESMPPPQRALLPHVDQMRLDSERWKWRNLPIPPQRPSDFTVGTAEWRRRLASGPPAALVDAVRRDKDPEVVGYFDRLSALDTGFVRRDPRKARFPRDGTGETVLFTDGREGITPADYLRYTWTLRSRYAGVLVRPERSTQDWRRIATAFRGDRTRIKPPRVLALMPLLQPVQASPRASTAGEGTPFLVVFDESWFREYGLGERVGARIARVKREIGEKTQPQERRFGPLPDHSVTPSGMPDRLLETELDCFGPFGFTLDRGDDQALANAAGFVVYPPSGTPAHYNLFVEFERLLDLPSGGGTPLHSEFTEALALYTLPDSAALWPEAGDRLTLRASSAQAGNKKFKYKAARLSLVPFTGATGAVLHQYRYLLIVGRLALDGGRAVEVFLPANGLWLEAGQAHMLAAVKQPAYTHGVVLEILLSGRHARGAPGGPLARAADLRELFRMLLPARDPGAQFEKDALGMIRRVSPVSALRFE